MKLKLRGSFSPAICIGGSGQSKIMRPIAQYQGYDFIAIFDDKINQSPFPDVPLYKIADLESVITEQRLANWSSFTVTIGNNVGNNAIIRAELSERLIKLGLEPVNLIHPSAVIYDDVSLGRGLQISANVVISANVSIGDWCIINAGTVIEHDSILGCATECAPGVIICGNVSIKDFVWLCCGSNIGPNINIGKRAVVGSGSVVLTNIRSQYLAVGIPARNEKLINYSN